MEPSRASAARGTAAAVGWMVSVVGSSAVGPVDPKQSDLDFLVEFLPGQHLGPWLAHYFEFRCALQDLFGRPVDLVLAVGLHNPYFVRAVKATRRLLYAAEDRQAVERNFETIGEAVAGLAKLDPETVRQISHHEKIIFFPNLLIHGYELIDDARVWQVIVGDVPVLVQQTENLLHREEGQP